jgi:GNAT superfamily N-acetyltransferase
MNDPTNDSGDAAARYRSAVLSTAAADLGTDVGPGTTVVASARRRGSTLAVAYPLGDRTIVWCSPELAPRLAPIGQLGAVSYEQFVEAASALGGSFDGAGHHRVLTNGSLGRRIDGYRFTTLDRDDAHDRALIGAFVAGCSEDDLDEAELAMDELAPAIAVLIDGGGSIASYASARPWPIDAGFDDIAVITHPDRRGRGLGAAVVGEFARRRRRQGRLLFYNCDVENIGSNHVAVAAGFQLVCTVVAVGFD